MGGRAHQSVYDAEGGRREWQVNWQLQIADCKLQTARYAMKKALCLRYCALLLVAVLGACGRTTGRTAATRSSRRPARRDRQTLRAIALPDLSGAEPSVATQLRGGYAS